MKKIDPFIRLTALVSMLISMLISPGLNSGSVVYAQPIKQEEIPTLTIEEAPTELPTPTAVDLPIEIPTDFPTDIPVEQPTATPTEIPPVIPTELPTDIPTELPTPTPGVESTTLFTETPTTTPTETPTTSPTPTVTPTEQPRFKWDLEVNLKPEQAAMMQSDMAFSQEAAGLGVSTEFSRDKVSLSGDESLNQVRSAIFDGLSPMADFLGGPAEIDIYLPAENDQVINLVLETRASTGYQWEALPGDGVTFSQESTPDFTSRSQGLGGSDVESFSIKSNGSGDGTIRLVYRRSFEPVESIHAHLNIWLPETQQSIDLSNPAPLVLQQAPENEIASAQENPFDAIAQGTLPSSWDWRTLDVVPEIRDQGYCGSCWAFATVGVMESALKIAAGITADISEQFLLSCNNNGWSCNGGWIGHQYHKDTIGKNQAVPGAVLESDKPYTATNGTCSLIPSHPYALSNWSFVATYPTIPTVDQIKSAIYTYGPVTAGICAGSNFSSYRGGILSANDTCTYGTNHAIILVGWNDAEQTWILRNSWGTWWGEGGYARIKWNTSRVGEAPSWVIYGAASPVPLIPLLITPAANAVTNDSTPTFAWENVTNGNTYRLQIDNLSTFASPEVDSAGGAGVLTYTLGNPLSGEGAWYWRVKAISSAGKESDWSAGRLLTLDTIPPAAPIPALPLDAATPVGIPTFTWAAVTGANAYQFEFDDNNNFSSPVFSTPGESISGTPLVVTSYKPALMTAGTLYYWRVRARDAAGNWGTWSNVSNPRSLIVQTSVPNAPALTGPATGYLTSSQPTLSWNSVASGDNYQVQISNTSTFSGTIFEDRTKSSGVQTHTVETSLTDGVWYWRVRAWNSTKGVGAWSSARSFIIDKTPPLAPALNLPAENPTGLRVTPIFYWIASAGANAYQFQYDNDSAFAAPILYSTPGGTGGETLPGVPLVVTSHKPAVAMTAMTPYFWRVRARDAAGNWGPWSVSRSITLLPLIPTAPILTAPTSASLTADTTPTFTWNAATAGNSYQIQVDNLSTFASPEVNQNLPAGILTFTPASPISPDARYYWRVRAFNLKNEPGAWSTARYFTIDTTPPPAPALYLPADNAPAVRSTPIFSWFASSGANAYQFQYTNATDPDFGSPILTTPGPDETISGTPLTVTTYKPASMPLMTDFLWRVRARDAARNWSPWSVSRSITILPLIPTAPILTAPTSASLTADTTPTFTWNAATAGNSYQIQVDNLSTFVSPEVNQNLPAGILTFTPASPISPDARYYWRVRAFNLNNEPGAWSTARYFNIDTISPLAPVPYLPANNAPNVRATPIFSWFASSGANAYQFQYTNATDPDFGSPILTTPGPDETISGTPLTVTSYKPASMPLMTDFLWRVRARDAAGNWSPWSVSRSIRILPTIPTAPVLLSLVSGFLTSDTTPSFGWAPVPTGDTYQIQISSFSTFTSPIVNETLGSGILAYTPSSLITPDARYYWRARAFNLNKEPGAWSTARSFTIDTTSPLAPVLYLPANNVPNVRATPIFSWFTSAGANAYQFQYDDDSGFADPIRYSTPGGNGGETLPGVPLAVTSHKPAIAMTAMTPYFWRVRARDAAGNWGPWSVSRSITILPLIPTAPILTSPASAFLTADTTPTFTWNAATAGNSYQIQVDNLSTFASPEVNQNLPASILTFTPASPISPDARYYWRVRAFNLNNEPGAWSTARYFTIDTSPPSAPALYLPAENPAGLRATPIFYWKASAGANAYQFQYDDNSDFSSPVFTTPGDTISGTPLAVTYYKPAIAMTAMTPYFWRVSARDAAGNWGPWSVSRSITILPLIPTAPILTAPTSASLTADTTPTFTWNAATAGNSYQIQVDNLSTFASPEVNQNLPASILTFTPASPISPDARYYWRVRAFNLNNEAGAWSTARYFTLQKSN